MTALPLFQLVDPGLCACGEKLTHPDEKRAGVCFLCMADAALTNSDRDDMRAEVVEASNIRSKHYRASA